jgi:hypothetical protein
VFRVLVRTFARSRLSVRSIHTRRWRRAGYVLRIASLTRPCRARTVPTIPTTKFSRCSEASRSILPSRYGPRRSSSPRAIGSR